MKKYRATTLIMLVSWLLFSRQALAGPPLETVETTVSKVMTLLKDPALDAEKDTKAAKGVREKIVKTIDKVFDFEEFSRRSLARHWYRLSAAQQEEFIGLFKRLLQKTYLDRITKNDEAEVRYEREIRLAEEQFEVQTKVVSDSKAIPIFYRLYKTEEDDWRVYDVLIENVSLVRNYRSQFDQLMTRGSPEALLKRLRQKVNKKESG